MNFDLIQVKSFAKAFHAGFLGEKSKCVCVCVCVSGGVMINHAVNRHSLSR